MLTHTTEYLCSPNYHAKALQYCTLPFIYPSYFNTIEVSTKRAVRYIQKLVTRGGKDGYPSTPGHFRLVYLVLIGVRRPGILS